jgi:mono/diheme cytochrome c family protein
VSSEFLVATFRDEAALLAGVRDVRAAGFKVYDVYAPYPVHGLSEAMGLRASRLPFVTLLAGLAGLASAVALQAYTSVYDWPLNVGGKPPNSTLAFVPITFELTVLFAGLATVAAFLLRAGLFPGARPRRFGERATEDMFVLALRQRGPAFDAAEARRRLLESGACEVRSVRREGTPVPGPRSSSALALLAAMLTPGCTGEGQRGWEYMPDMVRSVPYDAFAPNPAARNGSTLQQPVAGTIPRGFLPFRYRATEAEAERAGRELVNPFPADPQTLAEGRRLYETFCVVCHGARGEGDGPLVPKIPNPPSYTSERVRRMPAGQLFHVMTLGSGRMPSYASQVSADERWKIAGYVKTLQSGSAAP